MVKANTPGERDGRVALWVDGALIADFPNLGLRDIEDLEIDRFGLSLYIAANGERANRKWHDDVVAATTYIGPMARAKIEVFLPTVHRVFVTFPSHVAPSSKPSQKTQSAAMSSHSSTDGLGGGVRVWPGVGDGTGWYEAR